MLKRSFSEPIPKSEPIIAKEFKEPFNRIDYSAEYIIDSDTFKALQHIQDCKKILKESEAKMDGSFEKAVQHKEIVTDFVKSQKKYQVKIEERVKDLENLSSKEDFTTAVKNVLKTLDVSGKRLNDSSDEVEDSLRKLEEFNTEKRNVLSIKEEIAAAREDFNDGVERGRESTDSFRRYLDANLESFDGSSHPGSDVEDYDSDEDYGSDAEDSGSDAEDSGSDVEDSGSDVEDSGSANNILGEDFNSDSENVESAAFDRFRAKVKAQLEVIKDIEDEDLDEYLEDLDTHLDTHLEDLESLKNVEGIENLTPGWKIKLKEGVNKVFDNLPEGVHSFFDNLPEGVHSFFDTFSKGVDSLSDTFSKGAHSLSDTLSKGAHSLFDLFCEGAHSLFLILFEASSYLYRLFFEAWSKIIFGLFEYLSILNGIITQNLNYFLNLNIDNGFLFLLKWALICSSCLFVFVFFVSLYHSRDSLLLTILLRSIVSALVEIFNMILDAISHNLQYNNFVSKKTEHSPMMEKIIKDLSANPHYFKNKLKLIFIVGVKALGVFNITWIIFQATALVIVKRILSKLK